MRVRQWPAGLWRGAAGVSAALACVMASAAFGAPEAGHPPIVPGYYRLKNDAKADPATLGEVLLGELNCAACHSAPNSNHILTKGAPDLSNAGARLTPQYIRAYLSSPHTVKPGATMPDIFHASEAQSKEGAVDYLTHYLVSLGGQMSPPTVDGNTLLVEQGRKLFHTIGCVACHAPEGKANTQVPSVPLPNLAEKTTVEKLAEFLMNPLKVRPGSRMPNLRLASKDATAIAIYLLRAQLDNPLAKNAPPAQVHGVKFAYYEEALDTCSLEKLDKLKPKGEGRLENFSVNIPGRRNDAFAVKYTATLHVAKAGKYTFSTNSDDGSRLYIGDELVVNNDGVHAAQRKTGTIELKEADYPITVTYFQGGNESVLRVMWAAPGQARPFAIPSDSLLVTGGQPMIPLNSSEFKVDPQKAQMGAQMFGVLGCASCHQIEGVRSARTFKPLDALNPDAPEGCLGTSIAKGVPNYDLDNDQRTALKTAVKNVRNLAQPLNGKQMVTRVMAAFNCYACHVRDNVGGTTQDRSEYFVMTAEFDMGDEGRLPPRLTSAGAKLLPAAIEKIVLEGKLHIRPVLATRMPTFSKEKAGAIVDALAQADAPAQERQPKLTEIGARDGRTLVGTRGMGCVNCHGVLGVKSLGMPAPELTLEHERLRPSWFHELLVNPPSKNPATRMPAFWADGQVAFKNLADGTMDGQIDAIWQYLSMGDAMALPAGLQPSQGIELSPTDTPIVHRTMMAGAGNRSILVGFPESVHVAFDADVVRLAKAWKGRFFDARGWWDQRGGQHLSPLGHDIINLPPGPSLAILANPTDPWPVPKGRDDRNLGGRFKGYALDKEDRPIFHYVLADSIDIQEQPLPLLRSSGPQLVRSFHVSTGKPDEKLYFLAAQGEKIEAKSPGEYIVDEKITVKFNNATGVGQPIVRDSNNQKQLLLPITGATSAFSVEMSW
jgi:mono/diheme cytochrome c family protein